MQFDVVVGNPPFQGPNSKKGLGTLWPIFSKKAIEISKDSGIISFITPSSWMSSGSSLLQDFKDNNLVYFNLDCGNYFKEGSSFSYWILNKLKPYKYTKITYLGNDYTLDISSLSYIPNDPTEITMSILNKTLLSNIDKFDIKITSECHSQKTKLISYDENSTFKYRVKHTNTAYTYSSFLPSNFKIKKVLWPLTGNFKPIYDNGTMSTGQNVVWLEVDNKEMAINFINYIKSNLFKFLLKVCKWSGSNTRGLFISSIPKIDI